MKKLDYIKVKSLYLSKYSLEGWRESYRVREDIWYMYPHIHIDICKYTHTHILLRITRLYTESLYINKKRTDSAIVKWARGLNKHYTKEDICRVSEYMKRFL